jgi:hypothetical protein
MYSPEICLFFYYCIKLQCLIHAFCLLPHQVKPSLSFQFMLIFAINPWRRNNSEGFTPQSTTYYLLPTTDYLLPTTYYLLLTTYYRLPTTYYRLLTTDYLLPTTPQTSNSSNSYLFNGIYTESDDFFPSALTEYR